MHCNVAAPDVMPILSSGLHARPENGACFMEMVSWLAGETWSDHPTCTDPLLALVARCLNDWLNDANRHLLLPLLPTVIGTRTNNASRVRPALNAWAETLPARWHPPPSYASPQVRTVIAAGRSRGPAAAVASFADLIALHVELTGCDNNRRLTDDDMRGLAALTTT